MVLNVCSDVEMRLLLRWYQSSLRLVRQVACVVLIPVRELVNLLEFLKRVASSGLSQVIDYGCCWVFWFVVLTRCDVLGRVGPGLLLLFVLDCEIIKLEVTFAESLLRSLLLLRFLLL